MATSMAGSIATRLRYRESLSAQPLIRPNTEVARKAPRVMNTPWPKFSTSIRPNTRVKPEAMMKMIMPMARPAKVSVTQVENDPVSGNATSARTGSSRRGKRSGLTSGSASRTGDVAAEEFIFVPSSLMGR